MAYLGVTPTQEFSSVAKQSVTGDGSVSYTLNKGVSDANDLAVFVNDVRQEPGVAYTASGNTITFTANLESTDDCYILHIGRTFSSAESPGIEDKATQKVLTITTDGHLVPTANVTYDLGTSDLRFRDIYLSGSSINLGDHSITANSTHISMGNVVTTGVMTGNGALITSLNASELASGTIPLARLPDDITIVNDLTIGGDFIVNGNTTTIAANELKVEDSLIQLASNNEISDTVDIGFVGHYYDGSTQVHTGFFRDASNEYYYLFNGYEEAAFDTATPPSTINRSANTFTLANFVANNVGMGSDPFLSNNYSTLNIRSTTGGQLLMGRDSGTNDWDFFAYSASTHTAIGTAANTYFTFHTDSTGVSNERMRIDEEGRVGIGTGGTFSTGAKFEVEDSGSGIWVGSGSTVVKRTSGFPNIFWSDGTDNIGAIYYDKTNGMRIFSTDGSTGNPQRMRIDTDGNVGIGIDPSSTYGRLRIGDDNSDIDMDVNAKGHLHIDGNGYGFGIALNSSGAQIYTNSSSRALIFGVDETEAMRVHSTGQVLINRQTSITSGTASKLCITGNIDIDGNPGSTNVIRLHQSATEMGQIYGHTTGLRFYNFSGGVTSIKAQGDAGLRIIPGAGGNDSILQLMGNGENITTEGFEIWYDNDVGDVHLNTTYNNDAASIRFHTKVGGSKSSTNERLTINGDGAVVAHDIVTSVMNASSNSVLSIGVLEIVTSATPSQIKITTNIPYNPSTTTHAHAVTIKGFVYGSQDTCDIQICWHVYAGQFYNRVATTSGSWSPVITLAVESGYVVIHLSSPGYWPKLYVESLYNAYHGYDHAHGWSWSDAAISADSSTPVNTVAYKSELAGPVELTDNAYFVGSGTYGFRFNNDADNQNNVIMYDNGQTWFRNGIHLGAASSSSPGTANLLDEYEEGSWSPTITGSSGASGQSYSVQNGRYRIIGSTCHISFDVGLSTLGTLSGSYVVLGNLPVAGVASNLGGGILSTYSSGWSTSIPMPITGYISGSNCYLMEGGSTGTDYIHVANAHPSNSARLIGHGIIILT